MEKDLQFGCENETEIYETLCAKFGKLERSKDQYAPFDFYNDEVEIELKSRRCRKNQYVTTMIGQDKVIRRTSKRLVLVFKFSDGIYFIEYSKEKFKNYFVREFRRYRKGVNDYLKPYVYIPVTELSEL